MLDLTVPMVEVWFSGAKLGEYANDIEALKAASLHADSLPLTTEKVEYEIRRDTMKYIVHRRITGPDAPALGPVLTISSTALTVTLDRPASGPTTIDRYELERYNGAAWGQIASGLSIFGASNQYADSSLTASTAYQYRCRAVDTTERASEYSYSSGTTSAGAVNQAPVWDTVPTLPIQAGSSLSVSRYCSDPEGDPLTFELRDTTPPDSTISVTLSGVVQTTSATPVGSINITVRASDGLLWANKTIPLNITAGSSGTTRYIESGVVNYDGTQAQPGDTVIIRAGTRGPLKITNLKGSADEYITVKNESTGIATISGSQTFMLEFITCEYVTLDGSNYSGATYGIKVQKSSSSASCTSLIKCTNLCKFITIRYVEVDGKVTSWVGTPAAGIPIGIQIHHNTLSRVTSPGVFQEGRVVEYCYVHNTGGEAVYCGANFTTTSMPMKNVVIRNNLFEDTGRDGMQIKHLWVGPCIVEGNTIRRAGRNQYDQDAGQRAGILLESSLGIVRNNKIYNTGTNGIQCYTNVGPDAGSSYTGYGSFSEFEVEVYNNLVVNTGTQNAGTPTPNIGHGITVASQSAARTPCLPKIYSNTVVDVEGTGINIGANQEATGAFARNNLLVTCGMNTSDGTGIDIQGNTTSSFPSTLFVTYDNYNTYANSDFHLKAATAAAGGTAGTHYSTTDIEGTTRVSPDRGAYEYI